MFNEYNLPVRKTRIPWAYDAKLRQQRGLSGPTMLYFHVGTSPCKQALYLLLLLFTEM